MARENDKVLELRDIIGKIQPNFDEHGLVVHIENGKQNGGDSCQRSMSYYVFMQLLEGIRAPFSEFHNLFNKLRVGKHFIRHPEKGYHCGGHGFTNYDCWSDPKNFSCDQSRALLVGLQRYGYTKLARQFGLATLKNFSRFQNNDLCGPAEWGQIIRASGLWYLWPLLFFTDFVFLLSNIWTVARYFISTLTANEQKNRFIYTDGHVTGLVMAISTLDYPTPLGWLARKVIKVRCVESWAYYFRHEGAPPLYLFIPLIKGKL